MNACRTLLALLLLASIGSAQDERVFSKVKLTLGYGMSLVTPDQINDRIGMSNQVLGSSAHAIKQMPEMSATFTFRPQGDYKILLLRAGYMSVDRVFDVSLPWTGAGGVPLGEITGSVTESYMFYPFSVGLGATTDDGMYQFQVELCYALSEITEDGSYRTDQRISYSRTMRSEAYSLRVAGSATVPVTAGIGVTIELGYRYLIFDEYRDEKEVSVPLLEFPLNGVGGALGLSLML